MSQTQRLLWTCAALQSATTQNIYNGIRPAALHISRFLFHYSHETNTATKLRVFSVGAYEITFHYFLIKMLKSAENVTHFESDIGQL